MTHNTKRGLNGDEISWSNDSYMKHVTRHYHDEDQVFVCTSMAESIDDRHFRTFNKFYEFREEQSKILSANTAIEPDSGHDLIESLAYKKLSQIVRATPESRLSHSNSSSWMTIKSNLTYWILF